MSKRSDVGGARRLAINHRDPAPTVMAGGIGSVNTSQYSLDGRTDGPVTSDKPPYRVPLMSEIAELPLTGLRSISTFAGCGGSSLGHRLAGFKVIYANEFIPAARDTYAANFPGTPLDGRDIREVSAASILEQTGLAVGELDLLDGSPPCASFSTAGKRAAHWGEVRAYSDTRQRTDDLFFEYARLVRDLQPRAFIAENVSGLVKGVAKGYFIEILAALKACGYVVEARVLDAQWLGVPQARQRLIFCGVRADLAESGLRPVYPNPLPYRYSVRDVLPWITAQGGNGRFGEGSMRPAVQPSPTIGAGPFSGNGACPPAMVEARVIHDTSGQWAQNVDITDRPCPAVTVGVHSVNSNHSRVEAETDISHMNLVRLDGRNPSGTVTAMGARAGFASITHPTERRKFSIAELRRICAFPDDFILTGSYAQQWERLGRAVPPVMMAAIAGAVRDGILLEAASGSGGDR